MPTVDPEVKRRNSRAYYLRHHGKIRRRVIEARQELVVWYRSLKEGLSCQDCGESDPDCLDFHHRDVEDKKFTVSQWRRHGYGKTMILAEIAKCDALCANCHRKRHRRS